VGASDYHVQTVNGKQIFCSLHDVPRLKEEEMQMLPEEAAACQ